MNMSQTLTVKPVGRIETLRRERGWRQVDLAARSELHPSVMSRIESGLIPGAAVRVRVARALDVPEAVLWPTVQPLNETAARGDTPEPPLT